MRYLEVVGPNWFYTKTMQPHYTSYTGEPKLNYFSCESVQNLWR